MKPIILAVLLSFTFSIAFAQTENTQSKYVLIKFEKYYNAGQPDSIFALFSAETKTALPLEKTRNFLTQLKTRYGNMTNHTFLGYQASFAQYKAVFEKGTISLQISADDNNAITGVYAKAYESDTLTQPAIKQNITVMHLPFKGQWTVFWGGDTKELNYHTAVRFQKNAFDIVINKDGHSFKSDGKRNEDYYAFGQQIIAPCDGEVVLSVDGVKDNIPGVLNPLYTPGNSVLLKTKNNEFILFAHFKQHSVKVKQGDVVKQGQLLGLCGNSGNSSEPHLHFHIQNVEDFSQATGVKCYFNKLEVNGVIKTNYSPIKGDRIQE